MMQQKVLLFGEYDLADKIMETDDPSECKKIGRTRFSSFDAEKWEMMCSHIVKQGLRAKFMQNEESLWDFRFQRLFVIVLSLLHIAVARCKGLL